ncbi:MAG TPA: HetP family heterocyst commitment protein [Nostocaceae cyanobacterium]|nr:HetP family heterocyst commitment protein [Nostocaceae cyanobacterium]
MQQLTPEQLQQIITTIQEGKYSWACVLMLQFFGENPLHYIPQRTYSRLVRENKKVSA